VFVLFHNLPCVLRNKKEEMTENIGKPEEKIRQEGKGTGSLYLLLGGYYERQSRSRLPILGLYCICKGLLLETNVYSSVQYKHLK